MTRRIPNAALSPKSVRAAAADLGAARAAHDQQVVMTAPTTGMPPPADQSAAPRMDLRMDGVVAHAHDDGWKELKTGCISTTRSHAPRQRPETMAIQAEPQSDVAARTDASTFGGRLWADARRRGVTEQTELVVLGDGASWMWNLVAEPFPCAATPSRRIRSIAWNRWAYQGRTPQSLRALRQNWAITLADTDQLW